MVILPVTLILLSLCSTEILSYKVAVVEYSPSHDQYTGKEKILKNLNNYEYYIEVARNQSVQLIVFPEYGLTGLVKEVEEYGINLNDVNDDILQKLEAKSKAHGMHIVVNLIEKEETPGKSTKYFNTNAIFSPNGGIIFKYRKMNLHNEPKLTPGPRNQTLTFNSALGITFGVFTGSDILYGMPAKAVLESNLVTNIIYPTSMVSTVPFYNSLSLQYGYAVSNGVNVLAAGYDSPKEGRGGSGIYLGDGTILETYIYDSAGGKSITREVAKNQREFVTACSSQTKYGLPGETNRSIVENFKNERLFNAGKYSFAAVDLNESPKTYSVCHHQFCCDFDITIGTPDYNDKFRLMAFDGSQELDGKQQNLKICSLVACKDDTYGSCGDRVITNTTFTKITVSTKLEDAHNFYLPVTLNAALSPMVTTICQNESLNTLSISTDRRNRDVLAFGLLWKSSSAESVAALSFIFITILTFVSRGV